MQKRVILFFFIFISTFVFSQELKTVEDVGFWAGLRINKKLNDHVKVSFEQQVRTFQDAEKLDDYLADFRLKYKINRHFHLAANIRYVYDKKRWKEKEEYFRYNFDLGIKKKATERWMISYRFRLQKGFKDVFTESVYTTKFSSVARNKIKITYQLSKIHQLYTSAEIFKKIEDAKKYGFDKYRVYLGDEIHTGIGDFDCSIGMEKELNQEFPLSFFFLKMIYIIDL